MNPSSSTTGARRPSASPSNRHLQRRWSALSNADAGDTDAAAVENEAIEQEIDEIKRYEVHLPYE